MLEQLRGRRVLVTGAGGFIGSHLVEGLVRRGASVRAFVHYNSRGEWGLLEQVPREVRDEVEVIAGDVRDEVRVRQVVAGRDTLFHLAALIGVPYSFEAPRSYVDVNVVGTLNLLQAAVEAEVGRFVHTSTSEVYGTARYVPMDEAHPLCPQSPYAASKVGADKLVESYHHAFGLPAVTVRPFNTFGPRQSARAIIPTIASQALEGDTVRLGSTDPVRDLTYVEDTVDGLLRAACAPGAVGQVLHLGTGRGVSVREVVEAVGAALGRTLRVENDASRIRPGASEVMQLVCDSRAARQLLGWRPATSLEEGLARVIEWVRAHPGAYKTAVYAV